MAVNYGAMDDGLLKRFWAAEGRAAQRAAAPEELADRCLIFYRGMDVVSLSLRLKYLFTPLRGLIWVQPV